MVRVTYRAPVPAFTWDGVLAWRMRRHLLDRPPGLAPADVVARLAGVQAQVATAAEQAVAVRRADARGGLDELLAQRAALRTWAHRGTLHVLAPEQAPAHLALLAAARSWEKGAWQREFATAAQIAELAAAAAAVLPGAVLTREELSAALIEHTGDAGLRDALGSGWGAVLKPLAWQGLLCNAVPRDGRVTFTSPATWLPSWPGLPEPDAAASLVIPAYLGVHGPATPETFDAWLLRGATRKATLRGWFARLVDEGTLSVVDVEGEALHARTADLDDLADARPTGRVRLLPAFDQYVLGPTTRDIHVLAAHRRAAVSRAAGWISPVVVVDGRIAGTWTADGDALVVELFAEAEPVDREALAAEATFLERVLGRGLTTSVTAH